MERYSCPPEKESQNDAYRDDQEDEADGTAQAPQKNRSVCEPKIRIEQGELQEFLKEHNGERRAGCNFRPSSRCGWRDQPRSGTLSTGRVRSAQVRQPLP